MVRLTEEELTILQDDHYLRLKQTVSVKVVQHLSEIENNLKPFVYQNSQKYPSGTQWRAGKISKGERYQDLPYFVLDYPRLFKKTDVFAFRTILWWGNELSCSLHLSGEYTPKLNLETLKKDSRTYFCVGKSPFEYHFGVDNFLQTSSLNLHEMNKHVSKYDFVKIAAKSPISQWSSHSRFVLETFARFLQYVS